MSERFSWLGVPEQFELNAACVLVSKGLGDGCVGVYQVGSSLERRDYRDVDVRAIMIDEEFDKMFPGIGSNHQLDARWALQSIAISTWLRHRTGLPVDFQIQRMPECNEEFKGRPRNALGMWVMRRADDDVPGA